MVRPLKLGSLQLAGSVLLAPLAGYADLAFRLVARSCGGVALATTPLLCPRGVLRGTFKSMQLAATAPADSPLAMQFYGADAAELAEAARWARDRGAHAVDLNMGCPVHKIVRRGGGGRLLCDPDLAVRLAECVVAAVPEVPVTAKLRLGWAEGELEAPGLAARLEQAGVAAVIVHGRSVQAEYTGSNCLEGIGRVVAAVRRIPVIGNGDVRSPQDARRMIERTGCAGVMIGRAALSAPWIFRDVHSYLATGRVPPEPTLAEKCDLMRAHFRGMVRLRGEHVAVLEFRKAISWYARHLHPCGMLRRRLRLLESADAFEWAVDKFLAWRGQVAADPEAFASGQPLETNREELA